MELRTIHTQPEQVRYVPKSLTGYSYALGSWVIEEGNEHKANVLASPSLTGTWPIVDWCRGYAFLVVTKSSLNEPKKDDYLLMKDAVDEKLPAKCN
jgi:hypothetical protein